MNILIKLVLIIITVTLVYSCIDEHVIEVNEKLNGSIYLTSQPSGAKIILLGTDTKKITPDSIVNLESGLYEVTLQLANYNDTSFGVQVFKNQRTTKNIQLRSNISDGRITINSNPANAEIFLNNVSTHKYTPASLTNLAYGTHTIRLVLQNYIDTTFTVEISGNNKIRTVNIQLKSNTPQGEIFLDSSPGGAEIFLNGTNTGKLTPDTLKNLTVGEYAITLKHEDYMDTTFTVPLSQNEKISRFITLKLLPPHGNIFVSSDPLGATIKLQGDLTGKQTPDTLKQLPIGSYLVTLALKDFKDTSFIANVTENNTSNYNILLKDTTSEVTVEINYNVSTSTSQIKFYFVFNQDIELDYIDLREPNSTDIKSFPYYSQHYLEGIAAELTYPEKKSGVWRFSIIGKKLGGRKTEFKVNKNLNVE